jgi:hypothetical protein
MEVTAMPENCIGTSKGMISETDINRLVDHLNTYRFYVSQFRSDPEKTTILKVIDSDINKLKAIF